MAPPAGAPNGKKTQRPVLPANVAFTHAFAPVPTPGGSTASNTYFPLPSPPPPLRSFSLQNGDQDNAVEEPSTRARDQAGTSRRENLRLSSNQPETAPSDRPRHRKSQSSASGTQQFEFISSTSFSTGSPRLSSSSSVSGRSALSIAEIDCFFVQGLRSSVYSAQSYPSSQSQAPSESGSSSAALSELAIDDPQPVDPDRWTSDESERERQRVERRAFMKARQELRMQSRKAKERATREESSSQSWRDAVRARAQIQASLTLTSNPETWELRRGGSTVASARQSVTPTNGSKQPSTQAALADATGKQAVSPSGPGPPSNHSPPIDRLTANLRHMSLSPTSDEVGSRSSNSPPSLSRFDSDTTEVGSPFPGPR